jgi:hypothetical protein
MFMNSDGQFTVDLRFRRFLKHLHAQRRIAPGNSPCTVFSTPKGCSSRAREEKVAAPADIPGGDFDGNVEFATRARM